MKSPVRVLFRGIVLATALSLVVSLGAILVASPVYAEMQAAKQEGYLADVLCATRGTALDWADMIRHPETHTVACLKEPPCVASGYGLMMKGKGEEYSFQKFNNKGNELALQLINKTKKKDKLSVEVTGQMKDGVVNVDNIVER
jgi:hypothetical protein